VWLVGRDGASRLVGEDGLRAGAAGADMAVVKQFVVARAELDEVVELRPPAVLDRVDVVRFELAGGSAAGVLAVP
jgi:hypothetical protein